MIHEDLIFSITSQLKALDTGARMSLSKMKIQKSPSGFVTLGGLVLRHGCAMPVSDDRVFRGPKKQCFKNAQNLAIFNNIRYCEGYAIKDGLPIPVLHAWCLDKWGEVLDPTWQPTRRELKKGAELRRAYYGMVFDSDYLMKRIGETERHLSLIDDWPTFPLMNERGLLKQVVKKCR